MGELDRLAAAIVRYSVEERGDAPVGDSSGGVSLTRPRPVVIRRSPVIAIAATTPRIIVRTGEMPLARSIGKCFPLSGPAMPKRSALEELPQDVYAPVRT